MSATDASPFPQLMEEPVERWQWPAPPLVWLHQPAPDIGAAQPCRIETPTGSVVDGDMLGIDLRQASLRFRTSAQGSALSLPFSRVRRLTLSTPLAPEPPPGGGRPERVPVGEHEREYRLWPPGHGEALAGRTAGHVETPEGLFLFTPVDDDTALQRVFVPRAAYARCEFGPTAQDLAAEHWIASPPALLSAIANQQRTPVLPMGRSLLNLGLVTQDQIARALAHRQGDEALGEALVRSGYISQPDLDTAIAHKMGCPLVDLARFPIDPAAARKLPLRLAQKHCALPILVDQQRLVVAMDGPRRVAELQGLYELAAFTLLPVLAPASRIRHAMSKLSQRDGWSNTASLRPGPVRAN